MNTQRTVPRGGWGDFQSVHNSVKQPSLQVPPPAQGSVNNGFAGVAQQPAQPFPNQPPMNGFATPAMQLQGRQDVGDRPNPYGPMSGVDERRAPGSNFRGVFGAEIGTNQAPINGFVTPGMKLQGRQSLGERPNPHGAMNAANKWRASGSNFRGVFGAENVPAPPQMPVDPRREADKNLTRDQLNPPADRPWLYNTYPNWFDTSNQRPATRRQWLEIAFGPADTIDPGPAGQRVRDTLKMMRPNFERDPTSNLRKKQEQAYDKLSYNEQVQLDALFVKEQAYSSGRYKLMGMARRQ